MEWGVVRQCTGQHRTGWETAQQMATGWALLKATTARRWARTLWVGCATFQHHGRQGATYTQGNDKAVINSDASGKRLDSGAAAGGEPVPLQADLDSRQGEVSSERVVQESRTEGSCMPGCDREQQQAAEERAATPPVERYFGVVDRVLDQMDGPHDNVAHMVAKLLCWRGFVGVLVATANAASPQLSQRSTLALGVDAKL